MRLERAVPVLQVADVGRSMAWYVAAFGFAPDPFPKSPPYSFAILRRDGAEMMLQLGAGAPLEAREGGWTVHLRVGPERVFYSLVEFEVLDPDGYRICVGGAVPGGVDVPAAREREETAH